MRIERSGHGSLLTFQWWMKLAISKWLPVLALSVRRPVWQSKSMCSSLRLHTILHERYLDLVSQFYIKSLIPSSTTTLHERDQDLMIKVWGDRRNGTISISVAITCRGCFAYSIFHWCFGQGSNWGHSMLYGQSVPGSIPGQNISENGIGKTSSASYCNTNWNQDL